MLKSQVSGIALASLLAVGGVGLMADGAAASGQSIGTCSLTDVSLFSDSFGATQCENFEGNDDTKNFQAFGQTWTFLGKDEDGTIQLDPDAGKQVKSGTWSVAEDFKDYAESVVVVLKASKYYSAYLFEDLAQYNQALEGGTFNVNGVTKGGKAALSHMSVYYMPRPAEPAPPVAVPEPVAALGLMAVAGAAVRMQRLRMS